MKQKVVIIGHGYTSRLGVIRALGRSGYEITVVVMTNYNQDRVTLNTTIPIDCYSKYVNHILFCPSDRDRLINLLLTECIDPEQKVVVFTDSDFSAATVDDNQEQLKEHFLFPHIHFEQGAILAWMDKIKQKEVAKSLGMNVAEYWLIEVKNGQYGIPEDIHYPCFTKPLASVVGGKRGLRKCNNLRDLQDVVSLLISVNPNIIVLVEQYKAIDVEYALMGISNGCTVLIPGIIKTLSLAKGSHFGVAKQGQIQSTHGYENLIAKFKQFVIQTGFVGIFDIDFYLSQGEYYFCEMNFRYGGSGYAYTKMGVNLPDMMVRMLKGEPLPNDSVISGQAVFVNERMCKDDWMEGKISTLEFYRLLHTAQISFIYDSEDTAPEQQFRRSILNISFNCKRIVKRLIEYYNSRKFSK